MIVMDDVSETYSRLSDRQVPVPQAHSMHFRELVHRMHDKGLVHGDIRHPNILVREDVDTNSDLDGSLFLVDFDWGGKESVARYPGDLNPDISRHDTVTDGGLIMKVHDTYMVDILFPVRDESM